MNFNEYQTGAIRTWKAGGKPRVEQLANAAFGIAGEAGEVVDTIKKMLYPSKPADKDLTALEKRIMEELGDLLYYIATMARLNGWSLETIAQHNADKLAERHSIPTTGTPEVYLGDGPDDPYNYTRIFNQSVGIRKDKRKLDEAMEKEVKRYIQTKIDALEAGEKTVAVTLPTTGTPEVYLGDGPDNPQPAPRSALDERFEEIRFMLYSIDASLKAHDTHLFRHEQEIKNLQLANAAFGISTPFPATRPASTDG